MIFDAFFYLKFSTISSVEKPKINLRFWVSKRLNPSLPPPSLPSALLVDDRRSLSLLSARNPRNDQALSTTIIHPVCHASPLFSVLVRSLLLVAWSNNESS